MKVETVPDYQRAFFDTCFGSESKKLGYSCFEVLGPC
jgi:hypothetical protein